MRQSRSFITLFILFLMLLWPSPTSAGNSPKIKYPGGRYYIWRYTLKDKQGTTFSLDHPGRWLTHKSLERRRRQGLAVDSTDLPVSSKYLKLFEKVSHESSTIDRKKPADWIIIGTSRWNNTILVRANDTTLLRNLATLD